jgi:hypothetical protein
VTDAEFDAFVDRCCDTVTQAFQRQTRMLVLATLAAVWLFGALLVATVALLRL